MEWMIRLCFSGKDPMEYLLIAGTVFPECKSMPEVYYELDKYLITD